MIATLFFESKRCTAAIPPKRNRKVQRYYDEHIYKERHLIECFFGKIKNFRECSKKCVKPNFSSTQFLTYQEKRYQVEI